MLPFHLLLNLANGCFPRGLSTKILCTPCQVIILTGLATQNMKLIHERYTLPSFITKQLPYFPALKIQIFPRKIWPKFDLRLMC